MPPTDHEIKYMTPAQHWAGTDAANLRYGVFASHLIEAATEAADAAGLRDEMLGTPDPTGAAIEWFLNRVNDRREGCSTVVASESCRPVSEPGGRIDAP